MYPIIDTHQHLWDLSRFTLHWAAGSPELARNYLQSDYTEATKGLNVVKAIYMEVDVDESQQVAEAEYIIDMCQRDDNPTVGAVISGRPAAEGFRAYVMRFKDSPYIKGIRQVVHGPSTPPGYILQPAFVKGIQLLGEVGLTFDICIRPGELGDAVKLVDQCPGTQFILDHCGNANPYLIADPALQPTPDSKHPLHTRQQWLHDIEQLAARANVVSKISGIVAQAKPGWTADTLAPPVNHCLNTFGPERVIFGGDWPVCTLGAPYRDWAGALREIIAGRSEEEQKKLLAGNAERVYRLG